MPEFTTEQSVFTKLNLNVFDMVNTAIEDYNEYTRRKDVTKLSYDEKRGLFYNCLRRWVGFGTGRRPSLYVDDLRCFFDEYGRIESYTIPKSLWSSWNSNYSDVVMDMKTIGERIKKFYPTKVLNEMALIVNSI